MTRTEDLSSFNVNDKALSRKALFWTHALEKRISLEMSTPYDGVAGKLLSINCADLFTDNESLANRLNLWKLVKHAHVFSWGIYYIWGCVDQVSMTRSEMLNDIPFTGSSDYFISTVVFVFGRCCIFELDSRISTVV